MFKDFIMKVLYVDDEEINLMLFEAILETKYEVITALDGLLALEALEKNPDINIVFSDMKMPKMNGLQFITAAKEKYASIPYYLLTGFDISEEIQEYIDNGDIVDCLRKPFEMERIIKEIEKINE